jgi:hypothetical protein
MPVEVTSELPALPVDVEGVPAAGVVALDMVELMAVRVPF